MTRTLLNTGGATGAHHDGNSEEAYRHASPP
jgi:hypothetical protein